MLACISSEISTKLLGMPTHPDWPPLTASFCWQLLTAPLRLPAPTAFSGFLFPTLWLAFLCPLLFASKISSSSLFLVSHQNRQRDRLLSGPPTYCHSVTSWPVGVVGKWRLLMTGHLFIYNLKFNWACIFGRGNPIFVIDVLYKHIIISILVYMSIHVFYNDQNVVFGNASDKERWLI